MGTSTGMDSEIGPHCFLNASKLCCPAYVIAMLISSAGPDIQTMAPSAVFMHGRSSELSAVGI